MVKLFWLRQMSEFISMKSENRRSLESQTMTTFLNCSAFQVNADLEFTQRTLSKAESGLKTKKEIILSSTLMETRLKSFQFHSI